MVGFCENHPDSFLIRHKCPLTCGICEAPSTSPPPATHEELFHQCSTRRRWGLCSTRRRRNH
jgi:hypothetical protein